MTAPGTDSFETPTPATASALTLSARAGRWVLLAAMLLAAALMGKQWMSLDNVSRDASAYYLPLAEAVADGQSGLHPIIPPLYPTLTGWLSTLFSGAAEPQVLAGRLISGVSMLVVIGLIYALGTTLYGPRVAAAAATLTAANPYLSQLGAGVGPDMLYAALLTAMALALIRLLQRPTLAKTVAAAVLAALAALTRSEGILLPAIVVVTMVIGLWRPSDKRAGRIVGHLVLAAVVIGAVWTPRLVQMHRRTGLAVLDIRVHKYLPGVTSKDARSLHQPPSLIGDIRLDPSRQIRTTGERLEEAAESLIMVIGPAAWLFAALWAFRTKPLRALVPGRPGAHALLATIFAVEVLAVAPVMLNPRYLGTVTPLTQLWAALGLVTAAEAMRRGKGVLRRVGASMRWQWVIVALLATGLATWSLLKGNNVNREQDNAVVGREAIQRSGPGSVILASDPRPSYYARGRWVRLREPIQDGYSLTPAALLAICQTYPLDWIVVEQNERWCPWLPAAIESETFPAAIVAVQADHEFVSKGRRRTRRTYLLDAHQLTKWLQSRPDVVQSP